MFDSTKLSSVNCFIEISKLVSQADLDWVADIVGFNHRPANLKSLMDSTGIEIFPLSFTFMLKQLEEGLPIDLAGGDVFLYKHKEKYLELTVCENENEKESVVTLPDSRVIYGITHERTYGQMILSMVLGAGDCGFPDEWDSVYELYKDFK